MPRLMLTVGHRSKLKKIMREEGIYDKPELLMMAEGMLYAMRTGCPWRACRRSLVAGIRSTRNSMRGQPAASGATFSEDW